MVQDARPQAAVQDVNYAYEIAVIESFCSCQTLIPEWISMPLGAFFDTGPKRDVKQ